MKRFNKHIITLSAAVSLLLTGCIYEDEPMVPDSDTPVAVNMTRAEGATDGGTYQLMFWQGNTTQTALTTLNNQTNPLHTPWFHSLAGGETEEQVDYYKAEGGQDYLVTQNNTPKYYPGNNAPIHAVGISPTNYLTVLSKATNYQSFTINPENKDVPIQIPDPNKPGSNLTTGYRCFIPGLIDVCSTQIMSGTENDRFIDDPNKELKFNHTQVKLNFQYYRTKNLNGRVAEIWATIPQEHVANQWTLTEDNGFEASHTETTASDLVFASTQDFYVEDAKEYPIPMRYAKVVQNTTTDKPTYTIGDQSDCYVLPNYLTGIEAPLFSGEDGEQQYLTVQLNAVIISTEDNIPNIKYGYNSDGKPYLTKIPLTKENGDPWKEKVKPGDAFTITFIFDSKGIEILAKKTKWKRGSFINIPLNPY